jgi:hypothetical protein
MSKEACCITSYHTLVKAVQVTLVLCIWHSSKREKRKKEKKKGKRKSEKEEKKKEQVKRRKRRNIVMSHLCVNDIYIYPINIQFSKSFKSTTPQHQQHFTQLSLLLCPLQLSIQHFLNVRFALFLLSFILCHCTCCRACGSTAKGTLATVGQASSLSSNIYFFWHHTRIGSWH